MQNAMQLIPLLEPIRTELEQVECLLHAIVAEVEEPLNSMLRQALGGGKWLRSALVILSARLFVSSAGPFHGLAAAIEMLHTATLIHDDVVDKAPLRRGRGTLHTVWPAGATVLAGDYLLARAAWLIAELNDPRILKVFAQTLCTICSGEIRQTLVTKGRHNDRGDYYLNVEAKSAALFAAATEMAGIVARVGELQTAALQRFGHELGVAFQIVDDVLDFVGNETELGKQAGSDLRQGVVTLPTLYYLEKAEKDSPVHVVLSGQREEELTQAAIQAICSSGAIETSLAEAQEHVRRSREALATLPDNAWRQMLSSLAEYVVKRRS